MSRRYPENDSNYFLKCSLRWALTCRTRTRYFKTLFLWQMLEGQLKSLKQNRGIIDTHTRVTRGRVTRTSGWGSHWYHQGCPIFAFFGSTSGYMSTSFCTQTVGFFHITKEDSDKNPGFHCSYTWCLGHYLTSSSSPCRPLCCSRLRDRSRSVQALQAIAFLYPCPSWLSL